MKSIMVAYCKDCESVVDVIDLIGTGGDRACPICRHGNWVYDHREVEHANKIHDKPTGDDEKGRENGNQPRKRGYRLYG